MHMITNEPFFYTTHRNAPRRPQVEGIGYDFVPAVLDRSLVDLWVKSEDQESFDMARRLIREEGKVCLVGSLVRSCTTRIRACTHACLHAHTCHTYTCVHASTRARTYFLPATTLSRRRRPRSPTRPGILCGGSSGSAMYCALKAAKILKLGKGARMVVLLPDSVRNYMSKFLNDGWMVENGFMKPEVNNSHWWSKHTLAELKLSTPVTVDPLVTCGEALKILNQQVCLLLAC